MEEIGRLKFGGSFDINYLKSYQVLLACQKSIEEHDVASIAAGNYVAFNLVPRPRGIMFCSASVTLSTSLLRFTSGKIVYFKPGNLRRTTMLRTAYARRTATAPSQPAESAPVVDPLV